MLFDPNKHRIYTRLYQVFFFLPLFSPSFLFLPSSVELPG